MLQMNKEFRRGILFLRLNGELDRKANFNLDYNLNNLVDDIGIKYLVLNIEELSFIDIYGIRTIINISRKLSDNSGKLIVCGSNIPNLKCLTKITNEINAFNMVEI